MDEYLSSYKVIGENILIFSKQPFKERSMSFHKAKLHSWFDMADSSQYCLQNTSFWKNSHTVLDKYLINLVFYFLGNLQHELRKIVHEQAKHIRDISPVHTDSFSSGTSEATENSFVLIGPSG